jgi:hypothetical protein
MKSRTFTPLHGSSSLDGSSAVQRVVEIDARLLPISAHRALRDAAHFGNFRQRETTEKLEIDYLTELVIERRKLVELFTELRQLRNVG